MSATFATPLLMAVDGALTLMGKAGTLGKVVDTLPFPEAANDLDALLPALAGIGVGAERIPWARWQRLVGESPPEGSLLIGDRRVRLCRPLGDQPAWHDPDGRPTDEPPGRDDVLVLLRSVEPTPVAGVPRLRAFEDLAHEARGELAGVFAAGFVISLLALAVSLFSMVVYNTVIPSGSETTLWGLMVGGAIGILGMTLLRVSRQRVLVALGTWAGLRIGRMALAQALALPLDVQQRLGVENALIRQRSIEGVRQWFGGAGGVINVDFPFVVVHLAVIAWLGGWIVVVPTLSLLCFALLAWPLSTSVEGHAMSVGRASRRLTETLTVAVHRLRALRGVRASAFWQGHLSRLAIEQTRANRDHAIAGARVAAVGNTLGMLTVLATLAAGVALVLKGQMDAGGLIAAMMLIWRITSPAQQMLGSVVRWRQLADATRQFGRLMATPGETALGTVSPGERSGVGIEVDRAFYRHAPDADPSLNGVSLRIRPGQRVAVVGPNGAGKSTLLELVAGLRAAQGGRLFVDGCDLRQIDPMAHRRRVGYVPSGGEALPLPVRDQLLARCPGADDSVLLSALARAGGPGWWRWFGATSANAALDALPTRGIEGVEPRRQRLLLDLASAMIAKPPIVLLDDPVADLDPCFEGPLKSLLDEWREAGSTVMIATHRADLIRSCDVLVVLNEGTVLHCGPVADAAPPAPSMETP